MAPKPKPKPKPRPKPKPVATAAVLAANNSQGWERGAVVRAEKDQSPPAPVAEVTKLSFLHELLLNMILPTVLLAGAAFFAQWLEKAWQENPELVSMLLVSLYPFIDVYVEKFVLQTKTKIDDKTVASLKLTLENFAAGHEIELPNMDSD